jgi:hypothetical protein
VRRERTPSQTALAWSREEFGSRAQCLGRSLPARVLTPPVRAVGMGIHFTLFYVFIVAAPIVAGVLASWIGTAGAAFDFGAFMLGLCFPAYWVFNQLARRVTLAD